MNESVPAQQPEPPTPKDNHDTRIVASIRLMLQEAAERNDYTLHRSIQAAYCQLGTLLGMDDPL